MALVDRYGQDRNPLLQGLINPVPGVGVIPGKAMLDWRLVEEFRANAEDTSFQKKYPGGSQDGNHDVVTGMLLIGLRGERNTDVFDGEPNEKFIAAVPGFGWGDYPSIRCAEDQFYFGGVSATEYRVSKPMDSTTDDPEHGFATIRAGTVSVINTGNRIIYPNQWLQWQLPQTADLSDINVNARQGTEPTQITPQIVPFDYTDFNIQMGDAFLRMKRNKGDAHDGVLDLNVNDFFKRFGAEDSRMLSCADETALAMRLWIGGIAVRAVEVLQRHGVVTVNRQAGAQGVLGDIVPPTPGTDANAQQNAARDARALASAIGLTGEGDRAVLHKIIASVLMRVVPRSDPDIDNELRVFRERHLNGADWSVKAHDMNDEFARTMINLAEFGTAGITGSWYHQMQKIIGRSMNAAAVSDTVHLILGHVAA